MGISTVFRCDWQPACTAVTFAVRAVQGDCERVSFRVKSPHKADWLNGITWYQLISYHWTSTNQHNKSVCALTSPRWGEGKPKCPFPTSIWRNDNVIMTSKRRCNVVWTSQWRYHCVTCPLDYYTRRYRHSCHVLLDLGKQDSCDSGSLVRYTKGPCLLRIMACISNYILISLVQNQI